MGKKGVSRRLSRAALGLAEGVFAHTVDMALWFAIYMAEVGVPQSTSGQVWRAQIAADRFLHQVNYDVIKNALNDARKRGWIQKRTRHAAPEITKEGRRRLASVLPHYDEKRVWDGRVHLITYDIPEKQRDDRDLLREYLRRMGCGRLQDSVWMTPYNPIDALRDVIENKSLVGTVIVSDIGKDGSIGEEDLKALIVRVYRLEELNERYETWLEESEAEEVDHWRVITYLSILQGDPQLPFALLPPWWKGEKAYSFVRSHLRIYPYDEKKST